MPQKLLCHLITKYRILCLSVSVVLYIMLPLDIYVMFVCRRNREDRENLQYLAVLLCLQQYRLKTCDVTVTTS